MFDGSVSKLGSCCELLINLQAGDKTGAASLKNSISNAASLVNQSVNIIETVFVEVKNPVIPKPVLNEGSSFKNQASQFLKISSDNKERPAKSEGATSSLKTNSSNHTNSQTNHLVFNQNTSKSQPVISNSNTSGIQNSVSLNSGSTPVHVNAAPSVSNSILTSHQVSKPVTHLTQQTTQQVTQQATQNVKTNSLPVLDFSKTLVHHTAKTGSTQLIFSNSVAIQKQLAPHLFNSQLGSKISQQVNLKSQSIPTLEESYQLYYGQGADYKILLRSAGHTIGHRSFFEGLDQLFLQVFLMPQPANKKQDSDEN